LLNEDEYVIEGRFVRHFSEFYENQATLFHIACQGQDYDDISDRPLTHPTSVLLPHAAIQQYGSQK
jgi:hypothetical protein